ncbi:fimbrillin family protein [Parabacteroides chinchillae]|uniref:Fimbrillin-like n=1 Tax=Parabacteroides chinchillae TaxID=871327 RepID=A0A8G2BTR4_9BACT|nr:fimbrillin family protein [Parabacteroides chinchillae]SEF43764.1 Fimbrillin-like [Parabacteroides chinchillae]
MKFVLCFYRLLALIVLFIYTGTGCSSEKDDFSGRREIVLQSQLGYAGSDNYENIIDDSVFFAKGVESKNYTEVWSAAMQSVGRVVFAEPRYYPEDNSQVYLCGFIPSAELSDNNQVSYILDGQQDIMLSEEQAGSMNDMFWQDEKRFDFIHLLTQLRFQIRCDAEGALRNLSLKSIIVEGTQAEATLSLTDKSLQFTGPKKDIIGYDYTDGDVVLLGTDNVSVPGVVMIQPNVPVYISVILQTSVGNETRFEHLPVVFEEEGGMSLAGTSYLLSINVHTKGVIELSSIVANWIRGSNGMGVIE